MNYFIFKFENNKNFYYYYNKNHGILSVIFNINFYYCYVIARVHYKEMGSLAKVT